MSTSVYFFGGYLASRKDIDAWLGSAKQQSPSMDFLGFPWPSNTPSAPETAVVDGSRGSGLFQFAVETIRECSEDADKIYLIGHSSGCAIANAVDRELKKTNVVLVALDGFRPKAEQLERKSTQVWGAECEGQKSLHYPSPSQKGRQIYFATNCKELWALHFSLVNANATDKTVRDIFTGYYNCKANMAWLTPK
jgi:hypothetical protein